jgi:hypothetical protein
VVVLGLANGVAVTLGSMGLYQRLRRRTQRPIPVRATLGRVLVATAVGAGLAWLIVTVIGWDSRVEALLGLVVSGIAGLVAYAALLLVMREPVVLGLQARVGRRR